MSPKSADAVEQQPPRATNFGCASVLLVLGGCVVAALLGGTSGLLVRESVLVLWVPLASVLLMLWPPRRHVRRTTWLARALLGLFIAWASGWVILHPVVHRDCCSICPCGDYPTLMAFPTFPTVIVFVAAWAAREAARRFERWLSSVGTTRRAAILVRSTHAVLMIGCVAIVLSLVALARKPSPSIEEWVASLPEVGVVFGRPAVGVWQEHPDGTRTVVVGDVHLLMNRRGKLGAGLGRRPARSDSYVSLEDAPISVRVDRARGLIVLECATAPDRRVNNLGARRAVFTFAGEATALTAHDVRALVAPPVTWILLAVGAALLSFARVRTTRRPAGERRDATHVGDGIVRDEYGERTIGLARKLPIGPVIVTETLSRADEPYRSDGASVVSVIPGTIEQVDDAAALRAAFALAVASLGTAPLIAACVLGLAP